MKKEFKKNIAILTTTVLFTILFCGCATTDVEENETNVFFESEIVDLLDYDIEFNKNNNNEVNLVIVTGRIQNKLDRQINTKIIGNFYDKEDKYLGEKEFTIIGLRGFDNVGDSTTFTINYEEDNANFVSYVKLTVEELD